jgi:hypothetical protein
MRVCLRPRGGIADSAYLLDAGWGGRGGRGGVEHMDEIEGGGGLGAPHMA